MYVRTYVRTYVHMYVSVMLRNVAVTSRRNVASMMRIRPPSIYPEALIVFSCYSVLCLFYNAGAIAGFPNLKKAISENQENIGSVLQQILKSSDSMTSGDGQTSAVIVALSVLSGVVVLILLLTAALTVVACRRYPHRKRK